MKAEVGFTWIYMDLPPKYVHQIKGRMREIGFLYVLIHGMETTPTHVEILGRPGNKCVCVCASFLLRDKASNVFS